MKLLLENDEIVFGKDETTQPQKKVILSENKALSSIIRDGHRGKKELEQMGLDFTYSHPVTLYDTLLDGTTSNSKNDSSIALDYFAGSGTTGHSVINLNRVDGGKRKFILVEMADYFDTVLLPRLKKVTFTTEWKDGKPKRQATPEEAGRSPRVIKVIRLESYEDALNNITFDAANQRVFQFDDYMIQYMLPWESHTSETLLNVDKLTQPFVYQLHIHRDGETHAQQVDLPETFNYLLGLHVQTRRVYGDNGRRYLIVRGRIDQRQIVVIWRETHGWKQVDFERDRQFVAEQKLVGGADEIFVNGDSFIPNARALEPVFKARMFAPVEA
jgi:adenine-specific DNA-methyltransferase